MPIALSRLKIQRISFVDASDNPLADVVLFKRKRDPRPTGTIESIAKSMAMAKANARLQEDGT